MFSSSAVLIVCGIICLFFSAWMMHKMVPREGRPPPPWTKTEFSETSVALGQFILMVAGVALMVKGIF